MFLCNYSILIDLTQLIIILLLMIQVFLKPGWPIWEIFMVMASGWPEHWRFIMQLLWIHILKLTDVYSKGNNLAEQYDIPDRHRIAFESGLSAIATFQIRYSCVITVSVQRSINWYTGNDIQWCTLYHFPRKKPSSKKLKLGFQAPFRSQKHLLIRGQKSKAQIL